MTNTGLITKIEDGSAQIKIVRDSACGAQCHSCGGCEFKDHYITADIKTEFDYAPKVGDNVTIELDNKTFGLYTIAGYAVFIVFLIIGACIGYMQFKSDMASLAGAVLGLAAAFLLVKLIFKDKKTVYKIRKSEN